MNESRLDRIGRFGVRILLVFGTLALLAPVVTTVLLSFSETFSFPPRGFTTRWYENFLAREAFLDGLIVSLGLAAATVVGSTVIGVGFAVAATQREFRGRGVLDFLIASPITIPRVALGVSVFLYFVTIGWRGAPARLLVLHLIMTCPYVVAAVAASLRGIDPSLREASMNLGASQVETFRRITLPLIRPGIVAGAVFAMVVSFDEVTASVFLTDARTVTFPVVLFSYLARGDVEPTVAAASSFMLIFVVIAVLIMGRFAGFSRVLGLAQR